MTDSPLETRFLYLLRAAGLPEPTQQYKFAREVVGDGPGLRERLRAAGLRDWRFDFCWTGERLAVEVQGGTWGVGRHSTGAGQRGDCEKINAAQLLGWTVLLVTTDMVRDGAAVDTVKRAFE